MIQRIQSLYLLLTSILSLLFLKGPYLTFFDNSGGTIRLMVTGLLKFTGDGAEGAGKFWILAVLCIIITVSAVAIIFFFRRRNQQLFFTRILIIIIISFIISSLVISLVIISKYETSFASWYKLMIPVLQLILSVLAYKGIKKDDELVRSVERLR